MPSVADATLLTGVLRNEWGFDGFVMSDCDTVPSVELDFHWCAGLQQSVAASVKAGNDLNCGPQFADLPNATRSGFVDEAALDVALSRLLRSPTCLAPSLLVLPWPPAALSPTGRPPPRGAAGSPGSRSTPCSSSR